MKGMAGRPGMSMKPNTMAAAVPMARWLRNIWPLTSWLRPWSLAVLVTRMPAAVQMTTAGIWLTSPSPTVSSE